MIELRVNGTAHRIETEPDRPLLEVIREDLHLTGTRFGCEEGACGACAVLVDGKRTLACITRVDAVAGKPITTIEGLATGEQLHPVQQTFLEMNAFQCGYCTAGMMISVVSAVNENPSITDEALMEKLDSNLCRCCGYSRIAEACKAGAAAMRATMPAEVTR